MFDVQQERRDRDYLDEANSYWISVHHGNDTLGNSFAGKKKTFSSPRSGSNKALLLVSVWLALICRKQCSSTLRPWGGTITTPRYLQSSTRWEDGYACNHKLAKYNPSCLTLLRL